MSIKDKHTIYTVGHSTQSLDDFIAMLQSFDIDILADIRRFPGSGRFPQFNKQNLSAALEKNGINYIHLENLGGRRKVLKDSKNTRWHNDSFRAYADYMETQAFDYAVEELEAVAMKQRTAYMCSEAVWWRCHRSMVSDYLKAKGWKVWHIMAIGKAEEHPYTSPARIVGNKVLYSTEDLFTQNNP